MAGKTKEVREVLRVLLRTPQGQALIEEPDALANLLREMGVDLVPLRDPVALELRHLSATVAGMKAQLTAQQGALRETSLDVLRRELQEMSAIIMQAKREIAALKPEQSASSSSRIMTATEELDAIVTATERATNEILAKAEYLTEAAPQVGALEGGGDLASAIEAAAMDILMACSFQDITGQRITKVVNVLRYLETRINSMVQIWGNEDLSAVAPIEGGPADGRPDADLLNGPQLEGKGVSQVDIDALFANLSH